ncbi:MAG: nickel-dependent lactate racemase [Candidatus Lokiarchaeota archaeon]|nr:nickel-dependent lactate racemase [Candidatus Lokiarchaeota archaeon]
MRYDFPYPGMHGIEFPDEMLHGIHAVKSCVQKSGGVETIIKECLEKPIGAKKISDIISNKDQVLIVVDDISRPTPVAMMLPPVLDQLRTVPDENIQFLIALGTHRAMTPTEIEQKLGAGVAKRFVVSNHEWSNPAALHDYGTLPDGTRVVLNKAMRDATFVIGVGSIAPHPAASFSGGGKIIAPGVATEESVGEMHWQSVQVPQKDILGVRDNPVRAKVDAIARVAGLKYIVNAIMDGENKVAHAVAGDPFEAHVAGCKLAMDIFGVEIEHPEGANIFITDTYPLDQDLWQGVKAMCALDIIVPRLAAAIIVTPAREGVSPMHPEVLQHGYVSLDKATRLVHEQGVSKVVAHNLVQGGRLLEKTIPYLVSPGVPPDQAKKLGFLSRPTPQAALDDAIFKMRQQGEQPRIMIIRMGGEIAPVVKTTTSKASVQRP